MFKTLEEVVDYYNNPRALVKDPVNIDESLREPLGLTADEKTDLINFLKTLTDKRFTRDTI
ncbi:MAG: cytochrome-c peroxidase, partial [Sediminibacterium sp.]|nr:cytochrome-c peroxidase [Sediminibacterium sp.]